jgi:hypothetical protein
MNTMALQYRLLAVTLTILACSLPAYLVEESPPVEGNPQVLQPQLPDVPGLPASTATAQVTHVISPSAAPGSGSIIYDVESSGTGAEKRAPYGDSYDINRLERPFLQDMTYVPDLDIHTFSVIKDETWYYVSIKLIGGDPNNALGINFGVELDLDHDGFGNYLILARAPYSSAWGTSTVSVYEDRNHDTAGLSAEKSDAPITTDGFETQIFHGGPGDADPDLAWVRTSGGANATVEFAFKRSWSGDVFMLGVLSDAGLKDVGRLDYVDRFTEEEAGSPVKDKKYYPLGALYAVDNTCQEAFGFKPNGYEPKLCPREAPQPEAKGCENPGQYGDQTSCEAAGCAWRQNPGVFVAVVYYCTYP